MMDERADTTPLARALLVVAATAVLALPVRDALGPTGVTVLLLSALAAVAVLGWADLSGRPLPRPALPWRAPQPVPPVVEDVWRSERWIDEAVARGLRALEEWRFEQRSA